MPSYRIPPDTEPQPCRFCQGWVFWVEGFNQKMIAVNSDGKIHWETCPDKVRSPNHPFKRKSA